MIERLWLGLVFVSMLSVAIGLGIGAGNLLMDWWEGRHE